MALKPLNSVDGFSVGANSIINVIDANGNVTANTLTVNSTSNLGNVGNVVITGGSANYYLQTDGTGNLTWAAGGGGGNSSVAGSDTQIQYNASNAFGASANFTFDYNTNTFTTIGTVSLPLETPIQFGDNGAGNYVALQGPPTINANVTWNLPNSDGNAGTFLATDGAGNMYWSQVNTGNITVVGRSGNIYVPLYNGTLYVVGRSGNIPIPV